MMKRTGESETGSDLVQNSIMFGVSIPKFKSHLWLHLNLQERGSLYDLECLQGELRSGIHGLKPARKSLQVTPSVVKVRNKTGEEEITAQNWSDLH